MKINEIEKQLKQLQEEVEKLKKGRYEESEATIENNHYSKSCKTVKIGGLEWMREDLDLCPTFGLGDEVRAWEKDGRYYFNWTTANIIAREIGDGWRLPTKDEFKALYEELGGDFQEVMKTKMNGHYIPDEGLSEQGNSGHWWSSTPSSTTHAYYMYFNSSAVYPSYNYDNKYLGFTVRLVRDIER